MREHLKAYYEAETALRDLGIVRTRNFIGDLAETIACRQLKLKQEKSSKQGFDAKDESGKRVQIKGIRLPNRQLGVIRNLDEKLFDRLAIVVISEDLQSQKIIQLSHADVVDRAKVHTYVNGFRLTLTKREIVLD